MTEEQQNAMRSNVEASVEEFFNGMTEKEIHDFVMAPYREAASRSLREMNEEREALALA